MELFKGLVLGQYVPVDSAVHRLDPRTKILAALGLLSVIFAIRGFAGLAVLTAALAAATLAARIRPGYVIRGVRPLFWLLVFAFALQVFFGEEGAHPVVRWGPLVVTQENLSQAAFYGWRLLLLVFSTTLMTDRKSTRLNSSHVSISYAVFCLKKKKTIITLMPDNKKNKSQSNNISYNIMK